MGVKYTLILVGLSNRHYILPQRQILPEGLTAMVSLQILPHYEINLRVLSFSFFI